MADVTEIKPERMALFLVLAIVGVSSCQASETQNAAARPPQAEAFAASLLDANSPSGRWLFQTSVFTKHYRPDPRHENHQRLLNIEYQRSDRYLIGAAAFRNSFGQASQYVYVGKAWPLSAQPGPYAKLTGGLLHGYKGEFRDKIPFNSSGIAPAILPAIGFSTKRFAAEMIFFGTNGLMFTVGAYLE